MPLWSTVENDPADGNGDHRTSFMACLVQAADVSNELRVIQALGGRRRGRVLPPKYVERKLGLSVPVMRDRAAVDRAKEQVGFINFLCFPLYETLASRESRVRLPGKPPQTSLRLVSSAPSYAFRSRCVAEHFWADSTYFLTKMLVNYRTKYPRNTRSGSGFYSYNKLICIIRNHKSCFL